MNTRKYPRTLTEPTVGIMKVTALACNDGPKFGCIHWMKKGNK